MSTRQDVIDDRLVYGFIRQIHQNDIFNKRHRRKYVKKVNNSQQEYVIDIRRFIPDVIYKLCWNFYYKQHLSFVLLGDTNSGKTTLSNTLLSDAGYRSSKNNDTVKKTVDQTHSYFLNYTIIDVPGDRKYYKNTLQGIFNADVAVFVVSCLNDEYQQSMKSLVIPSTKTPIETNAGNLRNHLQFCWQIGIKKLIICVNKLDSIDRLLQSVQFTQIKQSIEKALNKIGFKSKKIPIIPISAKHGHNVSNNNGIYNLWYKGFNVTRNKRRIHGYTLMDALENLYGDYIIDYKQYEKPLRFVVDREKFFKTSTSRQCVILGKIESGIMRKNQHIFFDTLNNKKEFVTKKLKVRTIQMKRKSHHPSKCGDLVGITTEHPYELFGLGWRLGLKSGDILYANNIDHTYDKSSVSQPKLKDNDVDRDTFRLCTEITMHCFVYKHHVDRVWERFSKKNDMVYESEHTQNGYCPSICIRGKMVGSQLIEILWKQRGGGNKEINPSFISGGDMGELRFKLNKPMYVTTFEDDPKFGRALVIDHGCLQMLTKVTKIGGFISEVDDYEQQKFVLVKTGPLCHKLERV